MKIADLRAYRTEQFSFVNKAKPNKRLELENRISYNVEYADNNTARGEMQAKISDKNNPGDFSIDIIMSGVFTTEPGAEKEKLHLATYDLLFPYVKAAISMFTANAGIPPVYLPYADISEKNIYRVDIPNRKHGGDNE